MDAMFARFRAGEVTLPSNARELGGRVKDGVGEYYREMLTPQRIYQQGSQSNWQARWLDKGKADHYAHAEIYRLMASKDLNFIHTSFGIKVPLIEKGGPRRGPPSALPPNC